MRLANGIVIDKEATFGALKFSALRREVHLQNEDGSVSEEIKERTYDLKSRGQGRMIQVSIPASVPLKEFDYNAEVELINPVADTVATATFQMFTSCTIWERDTSCQLVLGEKAGKRLVL